MDTVQSAQGIKKQEYIRYVYGKELGDIADKFFYTGNVIIHNPAWFFSINITEEVALWTYIDSMYSMSPNRNNYLYNKTAIC